jgi:hypothetical protein
MAHYVAKQNEQSIRPRDALLHHDTGYSDGNLVFVCLHAYSLQAVHNIIEPDHALVLDKYCIRPIITYIPPPY